jgi:purine-binding chemotaxis protein CheW
MEAKTKKVEEKYLTFCLEKEEYGIAILKVREIIALLPITSVPQAAAHVRGVINLRGKIVPVLDLRRKFGLPDVPATRENCIITVVFEGGVGGTLVGLLVDSVREVSLVSPGQVEPVPVVGEDLNVDYLLGMAKFKDRIVILLEVDKMVLAQDFTALLNLDLEKIKTQSS